MRTRLPRFIDKRIRRRFSRGEAMRLFSDLTVRSGPFKGMQYPGFKSLGSTLFPKLLGSYERELHDIVERACNTPYTSVVDIGCAEGYYAVGLAMRTPDAKVYAYDTNVKAQELCKEMAALNGVGERVTIGEFCGPEELAALPLGGKALIVSDCEGYEKDLFTPETVAALAGHDVLIETHDLFDITISTALRSRFAATHDVTVISSTDDLQKVLYYDYAEVTPYTLDQKKSLLAENRKAIMEWLFFEAKTSNPA